MIPKGNLSINFSSVHKISFVLLLLTLTITSCAGDFSKQKWGLSEYFDLLLYAVIGSIVTAFVFRFVFEIDKIHKRQVAQIKLLKYIAKKSVNPDDKEALEEIDRITYDAV